MKKFSLILLALFVLAALVLRFGSFQAPPSTMKPPSQLCENAGITESTPSSCAALEKINAAYLREIKPIFEKKCLACHGNTERLPLYAKIPLVSKLIRLDRLGAKKALDMSNDFPFSGSVSPAASLEKIQEVVQSRSMPPWQYRMMHWESEFNARETQQVLEWVRHSLDLLGVQD